MENRTALRWGTQEVGRLTAAREGSDTCFRAEYRLTEGLWRLYAVGRQNRLLLGCAEGGQGILQRRFSRQLTEGLGALLGGAADYVTKPFAIEELLARIRVALKLHGNQNSIRNTSVAIEGELSWGELKLCKQKHRVWYGTDEIILTNREFLMLQTLLENVDIVLTRETLLERVCGYHYVGETNVVDVYIRYLRSKIDEVYGVKMIETVRGVGYVIKMYE